MVVNIDKHIPILQNIIASINKHLTTVTKDFFLKYSHLPTDRVCINYNGCEIGRALFSFKKIRLPENRDVLIMNIVPLIHENHRHKRYFLWLHNTLCLFGTKISTECAIEIHYKTHNSIILHTIFKYYNPTAIHSARTGELITDRDTIILYQHSANNISFLERLGEIDLIIPCDTENARYANIINDWLIHKGGLRLPLPILVL